MGKGKPVQLKKTGGSKLQEAKLPAVPEVQLRMGHEESEDSDDQMDDGTYDWLADRPAFTNSMSCVCVCVRWERTDGSWSVQKIPHIIYWLQSSLQTS